MQKTIYTLLQYISLAVFTGLIALLYILPEANALIWTLVIPLVPISLLVMGYSRWRNICPLAWFSKITQNINIFSKGKLPIWFEHNVYLLQLSLLFIAFAFRLYILNNDAMFLAGFFIILISMVMLSGLLLSGKTWCNYLCPVGLVEKIYTGSNSHMQHVDSACGTCTACKTNCPDIDMESSYWKETSNRQKKFSFYAFPGLVFGFYFYYYLQAGNWEYYFSGIWTTGQASQTLMSSLMLPGFFFLPELPKALAVPLTLALSAIISFYLFSFLEGFIKYIHFAKEKDTQTIDHIVKTLAAFIAFNTFYVFAGAPTFKAYPYLYAAFHFMVIVISARLFWKEIYREEKFFIQERFARKILKKWKGKEILSKNLKEIYYTYANQQKDHQQHLENYKETLFELIADGILTKGETSILDKMRGQLGITLPEHQKIMKALEKEHQELFEENSSMTTEKLFQLKSYKSILKKSLEENKILDEDELEKMRRHFQIDNKDHEKILNELMNSDGILKEKLHQEMNELLSLYKIDAMVPREYNIYTDYLKFIISKELHQHLKNLESIMPLLCTDTNICRLISLFCDTDKTEEDLNWIEKPFRPLAEELLLYKNKEASLGKDDLKEAASHIFKNNFHELLPSLLLVLFTEDIGTSFNSEVQKHSLSHESVTAEIAALILSREDKISIMHKEALLHAVPLFGTLAPEYIETLAHNVKLRSYSQGEYIVTQGEEGDTLYIISKGSAKILINVPEGYKEVAQVGANNYIGEISIFSGEKRTASVQAAEVVQTLELSVDALKQVIYYSPGISFDMMRQMTKRLLEQKGS